MGAATFITTGTGGVMDAEAVFLRLRNAAAYEYGRGYSGSISEKDGFVELPVRPFADKKAATDYALRLLNDFEGTDPNTQLIDDKWGPAGAIRFGTDGWLFFGHASS